MTTKFKRTDRLQETKRQFSELNSIGAQGLGTRDRELEPHPVSPEELGYTHEAQSGMKNRIWETRELKMHCLTTVDNVDLNSKRNYKKYTKPWRLNNVLVNDVGSLKKSGGEFC